MNAKNTTREIINCFSAHVLSKQSYFETLDGKVKIVIDGVGSWIFSCRKPLSVTEGEGNADCVFSMNEAILKRVVDPKENPQELFLKGLIRVSGDTNLILKANDIFGRDQ